MGDFLLAEEKLGVRESGRPNGGPRVQMYQREDTLPGEFYAWCQTTLNAAYRVATGGKIKGLDIVGGKMLANGTASVGMAVAYARERGWLVSRPYAWDCFAMQLDSNSWPDHTGMIVKVLSLGPLGYLCRTIEGNTGSQSIDDGDGLYIKTRFLSKSRTIFYRIPGEVPVAASRAIQIKRLRSRRGFNAWADWYLGVGAYAAYGPRRGIVRPNVKAKVPKAWWPLLSARIALKKGSRA